MNQKKLSCWNCKGKHSLTDACPWQFCIFCWYQLVPGYIHRCSRDWVKRLPRFSSVAIYRRHFSHQIGQGVSWGQLEQERNNYFFAAGTDDASPNDNPASPPTYQEPVQFQHQAADVLFAHNTNAVPSTSSHVHSAFGVNRGVRGDQIDGGRGGRDGGGRGGFGGERRGGRGGNDGRPNDWTCPCGNVNFAFRQHCNLCEARRADGAPGGGAMRCPPRNDRGAYGHHPY